MGMKHIVYICKKIWMTENIRAYYQEHKGVFEENFSLVLESFNMEAIHKMRTSTKRLRALFILIEFLSAGQFKAGKQLRKIRTLFKYAGRIREIQIEEQLVIEMQPLLGEDFPEYLEYLRSREHREISRFLAHLPSQAARGTILDDAALNNVLDGLEQDTLKKHAGAFIQRKTVKIGNNIARPASNKSIHVNRTHLKQLYYLYDILTGLSGDPLLLGLTNERLRAIEQYFGEWHDLVNSPVYMNAFFNTKKFRGEKKYSILKKAIADKRKLMRKEIVSSIYPEISS